MAKVAMAFAAEDFGSFGKKADIVSILDIFGVDRVGKAGPAGARFELGL